MFIINSLEIMTTNIKNIALASTFRVVMHHFVSVGQVN